MTPSPVPDQSPREPLVLDLDDARSTEAARAGAKAANLARAVQSGMRAQPGFVVTTAAHAEFEAGDPEATLPGVLVRAIEDQWRRLSGDGRTPLVVRSSSTVEDADASSMAGQFRSVLDVRGWQAFLDASVDVYESARDVPAQDGGVRPMALLVQPFLRPDCGGVLFGVDPVTGDTGQVVVEAVAGGPESLVSGRAAAQHYVVTAGGRLRSIDYRRPREHKRSASVSPLLDRRQLRQLAELSRRTEATFGGPQDVEWAFDRSGALWLLQSRPVTATGHSVEASGPVLGPGPVAETFPDPLRPLEVDLWVTPLRDGIREALALTRAVQPKRLAESPVMTVVNGRVAADLQLFGYLGGRSVGWRILDPRVGGRRLRAAWQVGWLRASLPQRIAATAADVDSRLAEVPPLETLDERDLAALLESGMTLLRQLHRDEVLAGTLLPAGPRTAASLGLAALEHGRGHGISDADVVRRTPVVLSLVPPRVGPPRPLPPTVLGGLLGRTSPGAFLGPRETMRLRARWIQELTARAAHALGRRWADRGVLQDPESVVLLAHVELTVIASGEGAPPGDLAERAEQAMAHLEQPPLPAQFRLAPDGNVVPTGRISPGEETGVGAGGGRGAGTVSHGAPECPPQAGDVLVVRSLDPGLAPTLPGLAGLVCETGSTLSHLAILAREYGVPTVVAVPDAVRRFPPGTRVLVDGATGEVARLDQTSTPAAEVEG